MRVLYYKKKMNPLKLSLPPTPSAKKKIGVWIREDEKALREESRKKNR
jgi:hypothetical protein